MKIEKSRFHCLTFTILLQKKDIKDRLFMSETEGIVLSPQRRSFITGCQVSKDTSSSTNSNTTNTSSVLKDLKETGNDKSSNNAESLRPDTITGSRRVGSGRIRPSQGQNEDFDRERGGERADHRDRDRDRRFDDSRYGFRGERDQRGPRDPRDRERDREWSAPGRNDRLDRGGGRGGLNSRGGRRPRDNVPEWMDAPVNQDELMELRGFDESPEKEAKPRVDQREKIKMDKTKDDKKPKSNEFNIDDIIHMDVIPGIFLSDFKIRQTEIYFGF